MQNTVTAQVTPLASRQNSANAPVTLCHYGGGRFELSETGVYFLGKDKDGNEQTSQWVCAPLHVIAKTRDEKSGEWGRLLEWQDDDGHTHQWAMPLELLESDGLDVRRELARLGLQISPSPSARGLLATYIKVQPIDARARCVDRLGWHGNTFVTPNGSIGEAEELVVFQNSHATEPAYSESGTADEWRNSVAALAIGNTRLVFALSVAFAGALAEIAGEDSGGFHFHGASSSGKSTALKLAASVWGNPSTYVRLWRGTVNGLEGLATLHNDGLLILDEIGQIDPDDAGEAAYLLANGQGKVRASRNGSARSAQRWRLLFLSAGEASLSTVMAQAGKQSTAGQEIRLADIEADAGAGMGIFETLHELPNAAALALAIKEASAKYHGATGKEWLRYLVTNRASLVSLLQEEIKRFVTGIMPVHAAGQAERVARRFALVAIAGELATRCKLTGWSQGEAVHAARKCFSAWIEAFGGSGNREERAILAQVRGFFEMHGASRFEDINATIDQRVPKRAGFYRNGIKEGREFLILPQTFRKEICQGFDEKTVKNVLVAAELLLPGNDKKPSQVVRLPGLGSSRVYVIRYADEGE
jgi:putative DNA primase/helicase